MSHKSIQINLPSNLYYLYLEFFLFSQRVLNILYELLDVEIFKIQGNFVTLRAPTSPSCKVAHNSIEVCSSLISCEMGNCVSMAIKAVVQGSIDMGGQNLVCDHKIYMKLPSRKKLQVLSFVLPILHKEAWHVPLVTPRKKWPRSQLNNPFENPEILPLSYKHG